MGVVPGGGVRRVRAPGRRLRVRRRRSPGHGRRDARLPGARGREPEQPAGRGVRPIHARKGLSDMTEIPTLDQRLAQLAERLRGDEANYSAMIEAATVLEVLASAGAAGPLL